MKYRNGQVLAEIRFRYVLINWGLRRSKITLDLTNQKVKKPGVYNHNENL